MNTETTSPKSDSPEKVQLIIAEYNALRAEIIKRSEFRYQILSLTLIIAGSILTFGLQPASPSQILFVFPILGCFLVGVWAHNVLGPRRLAAFIREHIESRFDSWGWETEIENESYTLSWLSGIIASSGIFLGTEIITLVLGLLKSTFTPIDVVLIVLDSLAIIITLILLRSTTQKPKQRKVSPTSKGTG